MSWNTAKNNLYTSLKKEDNASEVEIDGQRVRKRTVAEMSALKDFMEGNALNETRTPKIVTAKYKVQAFNNGSGLI